MSWNEPGSLEEMHHEAICFLSLFDHACLRHWTGWLIHVLKETPEEGKWQAAVRAISSSSFPLPGGHMVCRQESWFIRACRRFAQPGAVVPPEVEAGRRRTCLWKRSSGG
jgi:hypothetical protein